MSAQSKTEEATPKKRRDSAERGQILKARDAVVACVMLCGVFVVSKMSLHEIGAVMIDMMQNGFDVDTSSYVKSLLVACLKVVAPVLLVCILAAAVPSLMQSKFVLATKALKINFEALNPVRGFKKIFNLRTVKDFVKSLLYLVVFSVAVSIVWVRNKEKLLAQFYSDLHGVVGIWKDLMVDLVLTCLGCALVILILDVLVEMLIHRKELRMAKEEVKRERKENEGSPEIKGRRKEMHQELLSEQDKHDIQNSKMIIANPTHVAVGIYFNPSHLPFPLVSISERNQRALAVRSYAEKIGVPVIVDVPLARQIYKSHKRYEIVSLDVLEPVVRLMVWLRDVELAAAGDTDDHASTQAQARADEAPESKDESVTQTEANGSSGRGEKSAEKAVEK
ncbi:EscU/YscU/HrcU family type III secretion system export apparatus switch protein [Burkholderia dolosa]|uniref:EscU/YscU/HrcU family type III secretion system export apparatus switch protein n=1 Tax=Burkholderia dolosa TaxID=152500 RepID=UPI001BA116A0|nr:EscU/YscU/HrcU family type III secretion system export apparatus switch protein [Burkholderia dolosa]MBR8313151.1 EscU/YscU/HrcU family type III secretion system export apparatus switch protein [Burkholderia dolosa]